MSSCEGSGSLLTVAEALALVDENYPLPNIKELLSLVRVPGYAEASAQLDPEVFPGADWLVGVGTLSSTQCGSSWSVCSFLSTVVVGTDSQGYVRLVKR